MSTRTLPYAMALALFLMVMTSLPGLCFWYEQGTPPVARATGTGPGTGNTGHLIYVPVGGEASFYDNNSSDKDYFCDPVLVNDDINSWEWDFGDGTPKAHSQNVTHTFEVVGTYVVTLKIDDGPADGPAGPKTHYDEGPVTTDTDNSVTVKVWDVTMSKCSSGWIPTDGGTTSFTVKIHPSDVQGVLWVEMPYLTHRKGTCSNAGTGEDPDLDFTPNQTGWNVNGDWAVSASQVNEATISITCHDYGAYGWLHARAHVYVDGDGYVEGTDPKVYGSPMPRDDNFNWIADAWEHDKKPDGTAGESWDDEEDTPVGLNKGDGFSRFDEYRGFMIAGDHTRTDPDSKKDVYIRDEDSLGLGSFGTLGLEAHTIDDDEWDSSTHKVNFNGDNNQCGILLLNAGWDITYVGYCFGGPNIPCGVTKVEIYPISIREWTDPNHDQTTVDPDDGAITSQVIAHELAHAASIAHHGTGTSLCNMRYPCPGRNNEPIANFFCTTNPGCASKTKLH